MAPDPILTKKRDYGPFIKTLLAWTQLASGPHVQSLAPPDGEADILFFFITLGLELSDTTVYEP
jgi:hypothetical protein